MCQRQHNNQPEATGIFLEAICLQDRAVQLQCGQQVEESMGGWVSREKVLWHDLGAEQCETAL